jgi:hypothetical protein
MQICHKILKACEGDYVRNQPNKSFYLFIGCTDPSHRGQGLLTEVSRETEKEAISAGYT